MRRSPAFALAAVGLLASAPTHAQQPAAPPATPAPGTPAPAAPAAPGTPAAPAAPGTPAAAQPAVPVTPPKKAVIPTKITSVCPGKILPLAVGNTWTYESVASNAQPPENMQKLLPLRAIQIVVTVTGAETKGNETTVKLTEKVSYDITKDPKQPKKFDINVDSTIVCTKQGKFDISPNSFFFAGEPGGYRGLVFTRFERKKETSLKLTNNQIGEAEWIEEIAADYKKEPFKGSNAKLPGGTIEIERKFTPQQAENVATRLGIFHVEKLGITTSGRIMLEDKVAPDGKSCVIKKLDPEKKTEIQIPQEICELPANWISTIWLADNVGVVQVLNPYAHQYQLIDMKVN